MFPSLQLAFSKQHAAERRATLVGAVGIGLKAALRLRKLLILRTDKMAKSREFAEAGYTAGTRIPQHCRLPAHGSQNLLVR